MAGTPHEPFVVQSASSGSNGLGIAGFVISLVGFLSCGLLSPLGALLSLIAVFKPPRGFAVAGLVLGVLGSVWLALGGLAILVGVLGLSVAVELAGALVETNRAISGAIDLVAEYRVEHEDALPDEAEFQKLVEEANLDTTDGWDKELRYRKLGPDNYDIRSAGPDGMFDTEDDVTPNTM